MARNTQLTNLLVTLGLVFVVCIVLLWPQAKTSNNAHNGNDEQSWIELAGNLPRALQEKVNAAARSLTRDSPDNYVGSNKFQQHGPIGILKNGKPAYKYGKDPGPIKDVDKELKEHGFYVRLSDSISLDREVPDGRDPLCKTSQPDFDLESLPDTTVVFVFYNEALSTLLRSIHSVLNRSPPQLLKEILLIDDGSDHEDLQATLEQYVKLLPKVTLHRQPERMGLVKARLKGAELARGVTFTVLDSHIEVQEGWLEPLMYRMKDDPTRVMMPMIDSINPKTFEPVHGGIGCSLGFLWTLTEHSIPIQPLDEARRTSKIDYVRSPVMAGGLFTFNRDFFWKLGGYDTDFSYWGTENLEISFRIWQCGGTLECSPCSRVYHAFRGHHPYTLPPNSITHNKLRTAAIWMDEYAFILRAALGNPRMDIGPLDNMLTLRKKLECRPFSWYMNEVYPTNIFKDPTEVSAISDLRNEKTNMCIDTLGQQDLGGNVGLYGCHGGGGPQSFVLIRSKKHIRPLGNLDACLSSKLKLAYCSGPDVEWDYTKQGFLLHPSSGQCMGVGGEHGGQKHLIMTSCGVDDEEAALAWKIKMRDTKPPKNPHQAKLAQV
eukprot:m.71181 g.71181  ORF g.71181 m.71181 type:complete len:603 (+) comp12221_c0_seq1:404-2212(+)